MKSTLRWTSLMGVLCAMTLLATTSAEAAKKKNKKGKSKTTLAHIEEMRSRVPATDPSPKKSYPIQSSLKGVHPRLFLTKDEFAAMSKAALTDEFLKKEKKRLLEMADSLPVTERALSKMFNGPSYSVVNALRQYPSVVMAYGLDPTPARLKKLKTMLDVIIKRDIWEHSGEADSGMGASCVMLLAAMTFDMIADELDSDTRKVSAERLFVQARRMYYLGHQRKSMARNYYWQSDPGNNHRWFRDKGLVSCLLAVMDEPGIEAKAMISIAKNEMDYVHKWWTPDGDCHEGIGYHNFGFAHLAMAAKMMDRVLGTDYLNHSGYKHAWESMIVSLDLTTGGNLSYGDNKNNLKPSWSKRSAFFVGPSASRDGDAQAALIANYDLVVSEKDWSWNTFAFYDHTVKPGSLKNVNPVHHIEDLGVVYLRKAWQANEPLMMFKCGPYGGHKLNEFRHSTKKPTYISVAHDDPDANTFAFILDGGHTAHPSYYDMPKVTANHNTIIVDGKGQIGEGKGWLQPIKGKDMRELSYITTWKHLDNGLTVMEGEAGNAYETLKRFRRANIWVPGKYVLLLDDIESDKVRKIQWICNAEAAELSNAGAGQGYFISKKGPRMGFQVKGTEALDATIVDHAFTSPKGNHTLKQTQFSAQAKSIRYAALMNPWKQEGLSIDISTTGNSIEVVVTGKGIHDTWTWTPAGDLRTPSRLVGKNANGTLVSVDKGDAPVVH